VVYLFFDRIGRKYLRTKESDEEFRQHAHAAEHAQHVAGD
jgi:multidrug efflux pump